MAGQASWSAIEAIATAVATVISAVAVGVSVWALLRARRSEAKTDALDHRLAVAQEQIAKEIRRLRPHPEVAWDLVAGSGEGFILKNKEGATGYNVRHRVAGEATWSQHSEVGPFGEIYLDLARWNAGKKLTVMWDDDDGQPHRWTSILPAW